MREWNGQPDEWTDGNGMDEHIGGLVNEWGNGCAERFEGECVGCVGVGEIVGLRKRLGCCCRWLFAPSFFLPFSFFFLGRFLERFSVVGFGFLKRFICRVCVSARLCVPGAYCFWVSG